MVYTPTFKLQIFENTSEFKDHIVIYGPKTIDAGIKTAIEKHLSETLVQEVRDSIILLKIDFDKIKLLAKEFPNIQHFCIKDINDDKLQDVIIKGDMLEKTSQYDEFVLKDDTKGDVNFLGNYDGRQIVLCRKRWLHTPRVVVLDHLIWLGWSIY